MSQKFSQIIYFKWSVIIHNVTADFGMDDREMMREEGAFAVDIIHGASASNLLLESESSSGQIADKSNHLEYEQYKDDFGDNPMESSEGGMLGKLFFLEIFF